MAKIERANLLSKYATRIIRVMAYELRIGDVILPYDHVLDVGDRYSVEDARWGEDHDGDFYLVWEDDTGGEFCDPGKQFRLDVSETIMRQGEQ